MNETVLESIDDGSVIEALSVTAPTRPPDTSRLATPDADAAVPRPVTVPAADDFANVTVVPVVGTVLPAASLRVAVRVRATPAMRSDVAADRLTCVAPPATTPKVRVLLLTADGEVIEERTVTLPTTPPVASRVATPLVVLAVPRPLTVPAPADCA